MVENWFHFSLGIKSSAVLEEQVLVLRVLFALFMTWYMAMVYPYFNVVEIFIVFWSIKTCPESIQVSRVKFCESPVNTVDKTY